ncbi:MAG: hypothetical protein H7147_00790 [Frankiaceae bacterium]|nr:hypothetical protein [Arenimonas sp.]
MKRHHDQRELQLRARRQRIAFEAARLMVRHGLQDPRQAKVRAARQLGFNDESSLPRDSDVREQLLDYQRLFRGGEQVCQLKLRREAALEAMDFLQAFQPRLVGSVLDGTADAHSSIRLQVFSDDPDAFARFLMDASLPATQLAEQALRTDRETSARFPAWTLQADGLDFEFVVLPLAMLRQAPLGANARPMARASATALKQIVAAETDAPAKFAGAGDAGTSV